MSRPVVVLDTNLFAYEREETLRSLRAAGFDLRVSAIALGECWARATRDERPKILSTAARRLSRLSDEAVPIEPDFQGYVLELGGELPQGVGAADFRGYRAGLKGAWRIAMDARNVDDIRQRNPGADAIITEQREGFAGWCRSLALRGTPEEQRASLLAVPLERATHLLRETILDAMAGGSGLPRATFAPFHAHATMMAWRAARNFAGARLPAPNDAGDFHQLAHLGAGRILATRDRKSIKAVDESGSFQAAWVCTPEQLLHAPPEGLPIGDDAPERAARFVRDPDPA